MRKEMKTFREKSSRKFPDLIKLMYHPPPSTEIATQKFLVIITMVYSSLDIYVRCHPRISLPN